MVSEDMTPLDDEVVEDETSPITDALEQSGDESTEEVDDNPVVRKSDLDALNKTLNDFRAEVGRLQSLEARVKRVEDPSERAQMEQALRAEVQRVNEVTASLVSGLDETAFVDPEVRRKVSDFLQEARTKAEREQLLKELKSELNVQPQPQRNDETPTWYSEGVAAFEEEWVDRIREEGYDDSATGEFKVAWREAGNLIRNGRPLAEARAVMRNRLQELRTERQAARQRNQAKRNAGAGTPKAASGTVNVLDDPNKSREEKAAELRRMGIQVGY